MTREEAKNFIIDQDYKYLGEQQERLGEYVRGMARVGLSNRKLGSIVMFEVADLIAERNQTEQQT